MYPILIYLITISYVISYTIYSSASKAYNTIRPFLHRKPTIWSSILYSKTYIMIHIRLPCKAQSYSRLNDTYLLSVAYPLFVISYQVYTKGSKIISRCNKYLVYENDSKSTWVYYFWSDTCSTTIYINISNGEYQMYKSSSMLRDVNYQRCGPEFSCMTTKGWSEWRR